MPVSAAGSGTQSATVTTEHTLLDVSAAGVYTLNVDTQAMQAADGLELRVYQMILTGGTRRVLFYGAWYDAQPADDYIKVSVPVGNELTDSGALRFTLKQSLGTSRSFPWKVLSY